MSNVVDAGGYGGGGGREQGGAGGAGQADGGGAGGAGRQPTGSHLTLRQATAQAQPGPVTRHNL